MNKKLHNTVVALFFIAVLGAFLYGSTGCTTVNTKPATGCPADLRDRVQARLILEQCTGNACELVTTVCMVSPDGEEPLFQ